MTGKLYLKKAQEMGQMILELARKMVRDREKAKKPIAPKPVPLPKTPIKPKVPTFKPPKPQAPKSTSLKSPGGKADETR